MRRGGGAQSCEARWEDRRVVSHLHIADVAFLLISTKHRRSSGEPGALRFESFREYPPSASSRSQACREEVVSA